MVSKPAAAKSYRELAVWQKGIELVKGVYLLSEGFPQREIYGLTNQIRRAAVSIPSNIAEGQARGHTPEFRRYLQIALGSLAEVDTQLELAIQLSFISQQDSVKVADIIVELRKMLYGLISNLPKREVKLTTGH